MKKIHPESEDKAWECAKEALWIFDEYTKRGPLDILGNRMAPMDAYHAFVRAYMESAAKLVGVEVSDESGV